VAHLAVVELVIKRKFEPESERPSGLAIEDLEDVPSCRIPAVDVFLEAREDNPAAYDDAEAWLRLGAAIVSLGGQATLGPHGSPSFWHAKHLSWIDVFLSHGLHCC
jgi:hypothetical protein